jgi:hypothetical protein
MAKKTGRKIVTLEQWVEVRVQWVEGAGGENGDDAFIPRMRCC